MWLRTVCTSRKVVTERGTVSLELIALALKIAKPAAL